MGTTTIKNGIDIDKDVTLERLRLDPLADMTEPPVYCSIGECPSMTAGNFSLINGKAKSGKTFFLGSVVASLVSNTKQLNNIQGRLPESKRNVLYFDTEQSTFHATRTIKRICNLIQDKAPENLFAYGLRPLSPAERLEAIENAIRQTGELGAVVIDGVRDLLTMGINDEAEATSLTSKFLKWTADYDMHLILLLHQNKTDLNARGHIGTEILNKAETTITISKDQKQDVFIVSCDYSRDTTFNDFGFIIEDGCIKASDLPSEEKAKTKDPKRIDEQKHFEVLNGIYKNPVNLSYADLQDKIIYGFDATFGKSISRNFITHYLDNGWIEGVKRGRNTIYLYKRASF